MMWKKGIQIMTIHKLLNISRLKDNQAMKYNLNFLIKPIFKMIKKSRQVFNILRAKRAFPADTKTSLKRLIFDL